jgi:hypothetical protein
MGLFLQTWRWRYRAAAVKGVASYPFTLFLTAVRCLTPAG